MSAQWQIRFDDGHQQRYLPDRQAVLREGEDAERHRRLRDETYSMPLNRGVGA